jgi:nucleoside-diphosphate-sugar epimerase
MSRSLVTGCAGFIGSHLCEALIARGDEVVGIDSLNDFYPVQRKLSNLETLRNHPHFTFHHKDLNEPGLGKVLEGIERVYHLAARAGVRSSWGDTFEDYLRENLSASQRLLESCAEAGLKRFVNSSSSSVYGNTPDLPANEESSRLRPMSPYGVTKLAAEKLCDVYREEKGIPAVSLRLFTVFGPRQRPDMAFDRFIRAGLTGGVIRLFGDGSQIRNFTYVADVVQGFILAGDAAQTSPVYNIGGGSTVRLSEVLTHIEQAVGKPLQIRYEPKAAGDVATTDADITLAREELGFNPEVDWWEGIQRQVAWVRENLD